MIVVSGIRVIADVTGKQAHRFVLQRRNRNDIPARLAHKPIAGLFQSGSPQGTEASIR